MSDILGRHVSLPVDACYPLAGSFAVEREGARQLSEAVGASGVQGIYPGDVYALSFNEDN